MTTILSQETLRKIIDVTNSFYNYGDENKDKNTNEICMYNEELGEGNSGVRVVISDISGVILFNGFFKN